LQKKIHKSKYNIGSKKRISNIKLIKKIINIFDKKFIKLKNKKNLIKYVIDRPAHDFKYSLNSNNIRNEL